MMLSEPPSRAHLLTPCSCISAMHGLKWCVALKPQHKTPNLSSAPQKQSFSPGWVMLAEDGDEAIAVRGLNDMGHFVHNDVFKDVLRLFTRPLTIR